MTMIISIATQFSEYPAGRYLADGPFPGEKFRKDLLVPALKETNQPIVVDLDGGLGYSASFLDEAFGGLVREEGFTEDELKRRLKIASSIDLYKNSIWSYIAASQKNKRSLR